MEEPTSVILALWAKVKKDSPGLLVKDLRGVAVLNSYSKRISNYCANCHSGMTFSVSLFSSNFQKF